MNAAIVLLAAGAGRRVGAETNKVLLPLDGVPVLVHSVRTALAVPGVHRIVVVVRPEDRDEVAAALAPHLGSHDVWLIDGGAERHDSEDNALQALRGDIESGEIAVVAIHDAARPLASSALFEQALAVAGRDGGAVPVVPASGLSRRDGSAAPGDLVAVQTPQAFAAGPLLHAYDAARDVSFAGTDTASFLERFTDATITAIAGEAANIKVTYPEDLALAENLIRTATG
ncbi:MAG: 2-C-methyl-D-erythritol 4-phosphate cytidylyltransferase [Nocardioidaceae bacterium]|nr:2-C-methyl-D-erythritol 4-phosphate cytidylyltransferase [Nocardioidaceae bacterium]